MDLFSIEGNGKRNGHNWAGYTEKDVSYTLNSVEQHAIAYRKQGHPQSAEEGQGLEEAQVNDTLNIFDNTEARTPTLVLDNHGIAGRIGIREDGVFGSMITNGGGNHEPMVIEEMIARRLTPTECGRLQGFPEHDGIAWCDIGDWVDSKGKLHKDSDGPKYKALGNSIALPYWEWLMKRIKEYDPDCCTMASLFDGISGFCLCAIRNGIQPIFSSEVEEFCIAVAKKHFGDDEKGIPGDIDKFINERRWT